MTDQPMMTAELAHELGLDVPVAPQNEIKAAFVLRAESDVDAARLRESIPTDPSRRVIPVDFDTALGLPGARGAVACRIFVDVETLTGTGIRFDTNEPFQPSAELLRQAISAAGPAALARLREGGDQRHISAI